MGCSAVDSAVLPLDIMRIVPPKTGNQLRACFNDSQDDPEPAGDPYAPGVAARAAREELPGS